MGAHIDTVSPYVPVRVQRSGGREETTSTARTVAASPSSVTVDFTFIIDDRHRTLVRVRDFWSVDRWFENSSSKPQSLSSVACNTGPMELIHSPCCVAGSHRPRRVPAPSDHIPSPNTATDLSLSCSLPSSSDAVAPHSTVGKQTELSSRTSTYVGSVASETHAVASGPQ